MQRRHLAFAAALSLLFACKSDQKKEAPAEAAKPVAPQEPETRADTIAGAAMPLGAGMSRLDALNLQIKLPPGSRVPPPTESVYDILLPGSLFVSVKELDPTAPKTLAEAKIELYDAYSASKLETEALAEGWLTRFESDVAGGHQHWLQVRRTLGDKTYECSASVPQAAQLAAIIEACKSLRR